MAFPRRTRILHFGNLPFPVFRMGTRIRLGAYLDYDRAMTMLLYSLKILNYKSLPMGHVSEMGLSDV